MFEKNYSVVLVDDEAFPRKLISDRLSQISGVTIVGSFSNGVAAKNYLLEHVVDIVITDIMMPFMDGLAFAEFVKQINPSCSVIIVSGHSEFEYARKAIQFGVKDYLLKPIQFEQLLKVVEDACSEVQRRRKKWTTELFSNYEKLEREMGQTFINSADSQKWCQQLKDLMPKGGHIIRLHIFPDEDGKMEEYSYVFRNMLSDIFRGFIVLRIGYLYNILDYLVIPSHNGNNRLLKDLEPFIDRTMKMQVKCEEVATINTVKELIEFFSTFKNVSDYEENDPIDMACRYMESHIGEAITRDGLAGRVHLHPVYFSQLFKKRKGVGYNEYLTEIRIKHAKKLLDESDLTIREVGEAVGFHNPKYFSNLFWERTGYMPTEYRKGRSNGSIGRDDLT